MNTTKILLEEIYIKGKRDSVPNISKANALYLRTLIRRIGAKKILEVGTAHGYSALHFADEMSKIGGHVTTIEFSQVAYEIASEHIEQSGLQERISQYFGDARDIIPHLDNVFDFIFIDGLKKASLEFFKISWTKVHTGGIIVVDDVIKFRYKMEDLYEYLDSENIIYTIEKIDEDDGIMIIEKK